jgi:hypothetical protein
LGKPHPLGHLAHRKQQTANFEMCSMRARACLVEVRRQICRGGSLIVKIPELRVEVIDDDIIVTMPGTAYSVAYYKPAKSPSLLAKRIADKDDPRADLSLSDFLAAAWHLANLKARELGWIV